MISLHFFLPDFHAPRIPVWGLMVTISVCPPHPEHETLTLTVLRPEPELGGTLQNKDLKTPPVRGTLKESLWTVLF